MKKFTKGLDKKLAGVCSGIADYLDIDTTIVRAVYACLTLFSACFPGVVLYLVLACLIPNKEGI